MRVPVPPESHDRGEFRHAKSGARVFWIILWALVCRDVRGRYRRSFLGPLWAIIRPIFMMLVFTALRGIVKIPSDGIPYPIFSFSVLVPWAFFTTAVQNCGPSVLSNGSILKKLAIDREVFPVSGVVNAGFDLLMSGTVLAGLMIWFRVPVGWSLLWLGPLLLLTSTLALAFGMFLAALGTYRRDFLMAGGFVLQLLMYATPIVYPLSSIPERWRSLYIMNPLVGILEGFRSVLAKGVSPDLELLAWSLPGVLLAVLIGWPLFRVMSRYFADVL